MSRVFKDLGFRTISIATHSALKGKDERGYLSRPYRDNGIFVTTGNPVYMLIEPRRHVGNSTRKRASEVYRCVGTARGNLIVSEIAASNCCGEYTCAARHPVYGI